MAIGPGPGAASELDAIRREYESSLSWRVTRPLRALRRAARTRGAAPPEPAPPATAAGRYDSWLESTHGAALTALDAECAAGAPLARFRALDDDLWALLLTQEYAAYPHIRALLPAVPEPGLQELWNGASGVTLAAQSAAFYRRLRERCAQHGPCPLAAARVLDFGCGWGRLTRFLARDVAPGNLYGCDPVQGILDVCRECRVPATLARSDFVPARLPFDGRFELAFAFSVFTHLSERAHRACLSALHTGLVPGGLLVVTVRPPGYLEFCAALHPLRHALHGADYVFAPHPAEASHPQYDGEAMDYGEAVVTLPYVRENWAPEFELLHADLAIADPFQVVLTLRRR
jgi:SAM-dependent methyltransferase